MTSGIMSAVDGYPTLCRKAFNGRLRLIFLDRCVHTLADSSTSRDPEIVHACIAARSLSAWFDRLERSPRFLNQSQRVELHALGIKFVKTLERLAILGLVSNVNRWRLQPKVHALVHISEDHLAYGYNARCHHCYLDEDHIGLTKRLALKCHRGGLLELRILLRWLLRLSTWEPKGKS